MGQKTGLGAYAPKLVQSYEQILVRQTGMDSREGPSRTVDGLQPPGVDKSLLFYDCGFVDGHLFLEVFPEIFLSLSPVRTKLLVEKRADAVQRFLPGGIVVQL